jgi:hypothetical protein
MNPPCNHENLANVVFKHLKEKEPRRKTPPDTHPVPYICLGLALLTSPLLTRVSVHISDLEAWLLIKIFQVVMSANQREIRQENMSSYNV